ncbi:MAG: prepilin-type N-terminal cleavage/methylation domain-containing protein, partial [Planctomycetota bacterium]
MHIRRRPGGFTLIEVMVTAAIFSIVVVAMFQVMTMAQSGMKQDVAKDTAEAAATRAFTDIGRDVRESSYPYVFAGDWWAGADPGGGGIAIRVARNYFSAAPQAEGNIFGLGITGEGWGQCANPVCNWSNTMGAMGIEPVLPMANLNRPVRCHSQVGSPVYPVQIGNFHQNNQDFSGRMFGHLAPGATCPFCGTILG